MNQDVLKLTIWTRSPELLSCVVLPMKLHMQASWGKAAMKVKLLFDMCICSCKVRFEESCSLELERKVGGKFHLKLNICLRLIANKYLKGKVKRTLKIKLKVPEIAEIKASETFGDR